MEKCRKEREEGKKIISRIRRREKERERIELSLWGMRKINTMKVQPSDPIGKALLRNDRGEIRLKIPSRQSDPPILFRAAILESFPL